MQIRRIFLMLFLALTTTFVLNAQSRAERRAKNRANQNMDREIDKAVDKTFNKVGDLFKKKKKKKEEDVEDEEVDDRNDANADDEEAEMSEEEQQQQTQDMINRMLGGGGDEEWEPIKNDFPISFDAEMKHIKKNKEEITHVSYTFDTWKTGIKMVTEEGEEMRMILDNQEGSMTTITNQDGKTQGFKMRQQVYNVDESKMSDDDIKITKTKETRTINGYLCTKYIVETKEGTSTAWVTKDINMSMARMFRFMSFRQNAGKQKANGIDAQTYADIEGWPIETTFVDKNGKETTIMTTTNIKTGSNIERNILDTSGIDIMSVGF